jgi:DNA-binding CsgD family transcriptional regulator
VAASQPAVGPLAPDAIRARVGSLPAASCALLLLAALERTGDLAVLAAAAGRSGMPDGLRPLEQSLLVSVDRDTGRLVLLHPLAGDTVVGMSTAVERRRAHRSLARALAGEPDRQAWHLAEATAAPDERVAVLLERTAHASLQRGDAPDAIRALTRAAELSPRRPDRGRRLVAAAAISAGATGLLASEAQLLADVRRAGPQPAGSLQAAITVAHLLLNAERDIQAAHRLLVGAILACTDHYDAGDATLAEALHTLLMISWCQGSPQLWKPFNDALARIIPAARAALQQDLPPAQIAAAVYARRLSSCREALWRVIRDGWEGGAVAAAINALVSSCADDWLTGQWDVGPAGAAIALGQEALAGPGAGLRLETTLSFLERQGAQPWAGRAGGGLSIPGLTAPPSRSPGTGRLTHQELEVATLAAAGLTNRQIAERLYLSPRTVSSHLHKLFPKLGVTSRAALPAALRCSS